MILKSLMQTTKTHLVCSSKLRPCAKIWSGPNNVVLSYYGRFEVSQWIDVDEITLMNRIYFCKNINDAVNRITPVEHSP